MENEKNNFKYELIASIIIGLATVFGAWASFQSSIWAGDGIENFNKGLNLMVEANGKTIQGYQTYSLDMLALNEYRKAGGISFSANDIKNKVMSPSMKKSIQWSDEVNKRVMEEFAAISQKANPNMSEQEQKALFDKFMEKVEKIKEQVTKEVYDTEVKEEIESWEIQSPRTDPNYEKALFEEANKLREESEKVTESALYASKIDDKYTLLTVFFTVVLFFAGISTTIKKEQLKIAFIIAGGLLLLFSIILTLTMPMAF